MAKDLIHTSTQDMTPEQWLGFRKRGIGASEVGAIMGLSQYKSNVELFYDKIGQGLGFNVENIAMFIELGFYDQFEEKVFKECNAMRDSSREADYMAWAS